MGAIPAAWQRVIPALREAKAFGLVAMAPAGVTRADSPGGAAGAGPLRDQVGQVRAVSSCSVRNVVTRAASCSGAS